MRPREKALVHGLGCLSNAELLAVLIGSGAPGEDASEAGQKLLLGFNGDLHALGRASISRFCNHRGIGTARGGSVGGCHGAWTKANGATWNSGGPSDQGHGHREAFQAATAGSQ